MATTTDNAALIEAIRQYWNDHIHDLEIATAPVGSKEFFQQLEDYRFDKLRYLPEVVNFYGYPGRDVLEVGCGVGLDLARFAKGGANVTGIDLAETSIDLAKQNFEQQNLEGDFRVMNGEAMDFEDNSFDMVYAHGVIQYTADAQKLVDEMYRVVKPGGEVIMMVYNRISWLNALSAITKVDLEHEDAPVLKKYSIPEFKNLLTSFKRLKIVPERFPVRSRLHTGLKGQIYNNVFVGTYNLLPKAVVRPTGWHIMGFAYK
jgi:ubiquinone/menaquinone biosynthesis C-methylase UbiE